VLKYSCESWTLSNDLTQRINAFEQHWCYRRLLKINIWSDKVSNKEVIQRMKDTELRVLKKLAFAGHVLRGSSGSDALQILEGKLENKSAQGRPRRMWLDDIKTWTNLDSYEVIKRTAEDRNLWRSCTRAACLPSEAEEDS